MMTTDENTPASAPAAATNSPATKPAKKVAKKKKPAKKVAKKVAKKSASKREPYPTTAKKCPYREGSMKAKAFAVFAKGGDRGAMITAIVKLGATDNTASSWIQFFRRYVKTGKK